jgi:SAM-dependent methyltransferase
MKKFDIPDINTPEYWNDNQTAFDFGLRQEKYKELMGEANSIVELGCGLSPFLSKIDVPHRFGIDFSPETVKKAKELYPGVTYYCENAVKTDFADKIFDVSVAGEVIEHLQSPEQLVNEMVRITKKRIIISTPHLEFEDPEHLFEFDEADLIELLEPFGKVSCETIHSERFPGRSYIFAICELS